MDMLSNFLSTICCQKKKTGHANADTCFILLFNTECTPLSKMSRSFKTQQVTSSSEHSHTICFLIGLVCRLKANIKKGSSKKLAEKLTQQAPKYRACREDARPASLASSIHDLLQSLRHFKLLNYCINN